MSKTITRANLSEIVYSEIGLSLSESSKIIDIFFDKIMEGLEQDGSVKIMSFGSFYLKNKSERIGRNPKTKEDVIIAPRKVVSFYPSEALKKQINKE